MRLPCDKKRIVYLAESTADITGLNLFPQCLTFLFEVDALFCNDDRRLNNITVIEQGGRYSCCPIFDNGTGLLSNTPDRTVQHYVYPADERRPEFVWDTAVHFKADGKRHTGIFSAGFEVRFPA